MLMVKAGAGLRTRQGEAGALEAVALEQDDGVGTGGGRVQRVDDAVDAGERAVDDGDGVGEGDGDLLAEAFEQVHHAERGADGVAVRAGVRGDEKAVARSRRSSSSEAMLASLVIWTRYEMRDSRCECEVRCMPWCEVLRRCLCLSFFGGYFFVQLGFAFFHAAEELVHAGVHFFGAVDGEGDLGDMANAHAVADLGADEGAGGHEAFESAVFFFRVAGDGDEDAAGFAAGREDDVGDVAGGDARVGEFAFEHGGDLFGEGADDSVAVMVSCSLFRHGDCVKGSSIRGESEARVQGPRSRGLTSASRRTSDSMKLSMMSQPRPAAMRRAASSTSRSWPAR